MDIALKKEAITKVVRRHKSTKPQRAGLTVDVTIILFRVLSQAASIYTSLESVSHVTRGKRAATGCTGPPRFKLQIQRLTCPWDTGEPSKHRPFPLLCDYALDPRQISVLSDPNTPGSGSLFPGTSLPPGSLLDAAHDHPGTK